MRRMGPPQGGGLMLPPLTPGLRNFLVGLFALYVLELVANNFLGIPTALLAWGAQTTFPWQPLTRFLVTGPAPPTSVLFMLLAVFFFVPPTLQMNTRREVYEIAASVFLGSSILAFGYDLWMPSSFTAGYASILLAMVTLFGLRAPDATVLLMFIIPIPGKYFIWLSGLTAGLTALAFPGRLGGDYLGAFLGVLVWWYGRGPGRRRRSLAAQGRQIERELRRFTVLDGGQSDDDLVH
jgi:hypothetical protein